MKFIRKNLILKSMMVIGTLALSIGGSLSFYYIDQKISAESVQIDDGPLGEKIVDIEYGGYGNRRFYGITEKGEVYTWGTHDGGTQGNGNDNLEKLVIPKKVLNVSERQDTEKYLSDIKEINFMGTVDAPFIIALSNNNTLYAWGTDYNNLLGDGENVVYPLPVVFPTNNFPFELNNVKDMKVREGYIAFLTLSGEVYILGDGDTDGFGTENEVGFVKIDKDYNGQTLPPILQITATHRRAYVGEDTLFLLANNGIIYGMGSNSNGYMAQYTDESGGASLNAIFSKPIVGYKKDGSIMGDVKEILTGLYNGGGYAPPMVRTTDGEIYLSQCLKTDRYTEQYYTIFSEATRYKFTDINDDLHKLKEWGDGGASNLFLKNDNTISYMKGVDAEGYGTKGNVEVFDYDEGEIPKGYANAKKVVGGKDGTALESGILSNAGGVYWNGKKISFGDISVEGFKSNNDIYKSEEKYNNSISLEATPLINENDQIQYDLVDLINNGIESNIIVDGKIKVDLKEDERFYKRYDFYLNGVKDQSVISFTVDLYKHQPTISGLINNSIYQKGKSFTFSDNEIEGNTISAKLIKDKGDEVEYTSGTVITDIGKYEMNITDLYGNTNTYSFTITDLPVANMTFTPVDQNFVFGSQPTKANQTLGHITLSYDDGATGTIQTINLVSGTDANLFAIDNNGTLKVGSADLDAKDSYVLQISGTDQVGMIFSGTINITIEKAEQPDYKIVTGTKGEEVYSFVFQNNDTIQIGTKGKLSSGTETLTITAGNGTIASLQGTTPETFKMLTKGKFTVEATATGDTNYKEKTVTQEITLSDLPTQDPLVITGDDTITYGDNNNTYLLTATGGSTGNPIQWSIDSDTGLNGEASGTNATISGNLVTFNHVGKFTLKATMNGNGSYQDVSATKTITVNKMNVTVTPNPVSKYVGQAFNKVKLKGVSYSPSPLSGDDIGTPAITSKYPDSQAAGIYNDGLEVTGLSNDNYTFQYQTGTLTILDVTLPEPSDQEKSPYYEVTGTKGKNGWYTSDIQIKTTGKDGYTKISQTNGSFTGNTITVSSEGETDISLYFQHTDGTITKPITYKAKIDKTAPSIPTMTVDEINTSRIARLLNMLSFGSWMNKEAQVTMLSNDGISGIDHYEYVETIKGSDSQPKSSAGTINYGDETELMLKARACDKAGNCSTYSNSEELKIDKKGPTILGVKDQSVYKQYYSPRFVTVTDLVSGLKQATYKKDGNPAGAFADNVETPIKGEGSYEIYAIDEAGNEITITFKILKLPNIDTEIDGSDESRDLIDQIIKEYEEIKDKIDSSEKDEYEEWIKDAEDKWESLRKKVIEHEETTSKVEGQGNTTFDPSTKLIVEEIPKDKVPVLPRNAIKTYDVRLMKGDKEILPNGDIKVYLPYTEQEAPIVYEINTDGTITELPSQQENGYVTFITNTLKKYAISNTKQEENKDPDDNNNGGNDNQKPTPNPDDGNGDNNGNDNQNPTPNPDDGNDPDNNKPDPNPDDGKNPDDNNDPTDDKVCSVGPDGKPNTNDDVCGKPNEDGDKPIVNPDGSITIPDGGSVIFPDGSEVELPDGGTIKPDGSVELPDGTEYDKDGNKKDPDKKQCDIKGKYLNIDSDGDGRPDVNLDINGDCYPDINIDTDNDGYPNVNIDTTGDGKPNINIDTDNDGKADINIVLKLPAWKPELDTTVDGFAYDTMGGIEPDLNIDTSGDGKPNINVDTDGDGNPDQNVEDDWYEKRGITNPNTNVKGNYTNKDANTGGVSTGDNTKWYIWLFFMFCTLSTMVYNYYRKHKQKL